LFGEKRVQHFRRRHATCIAAAVLAVACSSTSVVQTETAAPAIPAAPNATVDVRGAYAPYADQSAFAFAYRRLTESQYRHAIADAFGKDIVINARFEPERREEGLQAVGNARLSVTTAGLEQYLSVARSVADQVVDAKDKDARIGCTPGDAAAACAESFLKWKGRQLFRRPLTAEETARFMTTWKSSAEATGDFYKGLKLSLVSMLMSPEFLFRSEMAEGDPQNASGYRMDAYSKASRLSYLLWDSGPDEQLLQAAASGEIQTQAGLDKQVGRMLASPRVEDGVRAFFTDMLQFEAFDSLSKDGATYPKFSQAVADSAREETMKFLVDLLVTQGRDYRDIFTSRETFLNRQLAAVYNVPYASEEKWAKYTFPEDSERSGILTQATFLALFSHPAASSPTIRGVKMHEIFLCLPTPQPPPDVDFSKVQALENGTVRTRLIAHMTNPGCSTCHSISDPAGLTLERFDGLGQRRTMENGQPIDVSAEIQGKKFSDGDGLGKYMHDNPMAAECVVKNVQRYGQGRPLDYKETAYINRQQAAFAEGGYKFKGLLRNILSDPQFYKVSKPEGAPSGVQSAGVPTSASSGESK
jgi:uncharacterized protein DUF1592/uncharacterized protein DUF1588/uncharacterized protein DUF1595/uncharacterized protein DUF1587/uncharacterized protein DUF1585